MLGRHGLFLLCLFLKCITETNEVENREYRIHLDPIQVKPDKITSSNLFSWLNLKNTVKFRLWTRQNPVLAHEIKYNDIESLQTSHFDPRRLTKIIIHGFGDTASEVAVTYYLVDMRDAYLRLGDVNVFIIDYSLLSLPFFYHTSLSDVAGARTAEFLKFLLKNSDIRLDSIHIIGFSLGSHIAGLAGYSLNGTIGRITGLDPAGPGHYYLPNEMRLDRADAKFVDIIHTNAGKRFWGGGYLGLEDALGHVDIYVNGGSRQIGCTKPSFLNFNYKNIECSHGRAARYFVESITSPVAFPACRCETFQKFKAGDCPCGSGKIEDRVYMGEHLDLSSRGIFQLVTKASKPFGKGPQMAITLPNVTFTETNNNRLIRGVNENEDEAILTFNKTQIKLRRKCTFNSKDFPNNDIIKMCHTVLKDLKTVVQLNYTINKID